MKKYLVDLISIGMMIALAVLMLGVIAGCKKGVEKQRRENVWK